MRKKTEKTMDIEQKRIREKETVSRMIKIYCHGNHGTKGDVLCEECKELLEYAGTRVERCPHIETKTFCSSCKTHCYQPKMREKIREVMKYSGPRMMFYCPGMAIKHLLEKMN